ncbi:chemotaxis protein CheX [bacterium]|jgi:CheY-specific phosphatase CheX|nr:chemotaxis protein CheX [bacterium]
MPNNADQAILEAATRVFETSAFLNMYPSDTSEEIPAPDCAASMTFYGAARGRVTLRVNQEILVSVVENLLGESCEGPEAEARKGDALKELLNMLCGNILTEYFGTEPIFDLSPPELVDNATSTVSSQQVQSLVLNVENTLAEVLFEVQNQVNA